MRKSLCFLIALYQRFISPVLPPHCRYSPSCSEYAMEAIQKHGAVKGVWLGMKRLSRCKMPLENKPVENKLARNNLAEKKLVTALNVVGQTANG